MGDGFRRAEQVLLSSKRWKDAAQTSPERNIVWTEPVGIGSRRMKKVSVVYYLSRNGHLEHPHFMEVPLSCPDGLYLKDVISRLNLLRGKGMASMYSWSSKRSYKNGFVWHDLSENDYIHPVHGLEYVLKGSEILVADNESGSHAHSSEVVSSGVKKPVEARNSEEESDSSLGVSSRRNQPWSAYNLHEYKVHKAECDVKSAAAADASTQTDDRRRRRRLVAENEHVNQTVELEGSPPPVESSPETLESLMKADKRLIVVTSGNTAEDVCDGNGNGNGAAAVGESQSGRLKASSVLMQLITCGSFSFRDCGATAVKDHGLSLISQQYKGRMPNGAGDDEAGENHVEKEVEGLMMEYHQPSFERITLEDKEYFSGSVIETQRKELPSLKRSSSYNADRVSQSQLELAEQQEMGSVRAKCIPRKPKASLITPTTRKDTPNNDVVQSADATILISQRHVSKRHEATPKP